MEAKYVKDVEYELELEDKLSTGRMVVQRSQEEGIYLQNYLLRELKALKVENANLRKRLQRLETERKRVAKEGRRTQKTATQPGNSRGRKNSDGSRSGRSASNSKSVRFRDSSRTSNDNKSQISKTSKSNKSRNGQTTRVKVWKLLSESDKKRLRQEEKKAFARIPIEKWKALSAPERTVVAKERKLKIQQFQQRVTAIALEIANEQAERQMNVEAERAGKQMEEGKTQVSPPRNNPSQKPPIQNPGNKGTGGVMGQSPKYTGSKQGGSGTGH